MLPYLEAIFGVILVYFGFILRLEWFILGGESW